MAKKKSDSLVLAFFVLLIVLGFAAVLNLYLTKGVSWDFISHYLNAETMLKQGFYSHIAFLGNSSIIENNGFYFEAARAPLSSALMALSMLSGRDLSIPVYLAVLFALLGIALWSVSKSLGINPLLGAALMVSPYLLKFTFLFNSTEILSLTFVLLTVAFIAEKKSEAGIFMALAGLAKYTSLIFLPLLLLLGKPKKIFYSLVFFAVVTLPWVLFNYIFFGNPIYSYYNAIVVAVSSTTSSFLSLKAIEVLLTFLVIPSILLLPLALGSFIKSRANKKETGKTAMRDFLYGKAFLIISFLALGFADLFILGMHNSTFDQERFGYFFYAAFAVAIAFAFSSDRLNLSFNVRKLKFNTHTIMPYVLFAVSLFFILLLLHNEPMPWFNWMSQASNSPVLRNAVLAVNKAGLSNCRVVSNDWVYLKFLGIRAFSPFYYNSTIARYPIVTFDSLGTPPNYIHETNISKVITYQNYSILFPKNYICQ